MPTVRGPTFSNQRPATAADNRPPVLVSQNFYRAGDRGAADGDAQPKRDRKADQRPEHKRAVDEPGHGILQQVRREAGLGAALGVDEEPAQVGVEEALELRPDALAAHPDRPEVLFGLGLAQYRLGSFDAAVASLGRAALELAQGLADGRLPGAEFLGQPGAAACPQMLSQRLARVGIAHRYEEFDDNHSSIDYRMDVSLPLLYRALKP